MNARLAAAAAVLVASVGLAALAVTGCVEGNCPEPARIPTEISGLYEQRSDAGTPFTNGRLDVGATETVLEYTTADGSRWRARYAVR